MKVAVCSNGEGQLVKPLLTEQGKDDGNTKSEDPDTYTKSSECLPLRWLLEANAFIWRKGVFFVLSFLFVIYFVHLSNDYSSHIVVVPVYSNSTMPNGYLVWSEKCQLKETDPYAPDIVGLVKRYKPVVCPTSLNLTRLVFNSTTQQYTLSINDEEVKKLAGKPRCCYEVIERVSTRSEKDDYVTYTQCYSFIKPVNLAVDIDNILVQCKIGETEIYYHGYPMMPERAKLRNCINKYKQNHKQRPVSIIMLGIDSVSRINLKRAMPVTAKYLADNKWYEMSGYNKVGLNTFPNLMAVLSGYEKKAAEKKCSPGKVGGLDRCPLIWKLFQKFGYATAYAEDSAGLSTFNYHKKGFSKPPVDHYLRPFMLGVKHKLKSSGTCIGGQTEASYVFDYALEMESRYRDDPYFGLFWTNSFSHNYLNQITSMDGNILEYLKEFEKRGAFNRSVVVFFSDHGMRFGDIRNTVSGYYEDHLPFFFIWVPPWLQDSHPEFVYALNVNKNRLTSPYDLHMTLNHLLQLSGRIRRQKPAQGCPNCQSLLKIVPNERSCADAGIGENWCTCIHYTQSDMGSKKVKKITKFVLDHINHIIATYKNGSLVDQCAVLSIKDIINARVDYVATNQKIETYIISFRTNPNNSEFEAVVRYMLKKDEMEIRGDIYRTSSYVPDADCVYDKFAKNYCSCRKIFAIPKKTAHNEN